MKTSTCLVLILLFASACREESSNQRHKNLTTDEREALVAAIENPAAPVVTEVPETVTPAPTVPVEEPKNEEKETSIAAGTEASAEGTTPVTSPEQTAPESPAAQDLVLECQAAGSVAQQSVQQFPVTCSK